MTTSFLRHLLAILLMAVTVCPGTASAQERRPIDSRHPMWMIHIDVWNNADPQKIIDLIPKDIKPYVCLNLSMSCSFDDVLGVHKKPQDAIQTYHSWASVCCLNNMWFTCQPASGGRSHIDDKTELNNGLKTFEAFFQYKNFLGWNYAEQFWGFNEGPDTSIGGKYTNSKSDVDRIALFAKLVPLHHKYGCFLTISFCGNIWSHPLNPVGMMKRNSNFLKACKENPEAILFLYKYTTSANWFNNESVTIAPFISGLAKNYGVRYDNCGWNGAVGDALMKDDGKTHTYPGAVGIAPVLEQMTLNGACVWDGPELIWTEDFKETGRTDDNGYTRRNWTTYPNFDNIWVDMFRKVLDGTIHIATREEVIERTKICIKNDISAGSDGTGLKVNAYAAPIDLYHGLYLQDDPFNARTSNESGFGNINGYGNNNFLYFKKTGRYQTIPVVIDLYDDLAKTIPYVVKRSAINNKTKWSTRSAKVKDFNKYYPEVSKGDLFVARHHNELTCYFPYSYCNKKKRASAIVPLQYNTCDSVKLDFGKFDAALMHEYEDRMVFYFNNYRADSTEQRTDTVIVYGAVEKPTYTSKKRTSAASGSVKEVWDEATGRYTLTLKHNGPYDITIKCAGKGTDRLTDYVDVTPITEQPLQPGDYYGDLILEAEDLDYKSISSCVTNQYDDGWGAYRSVRGHSGMGFANMGSNTAGALRGSVKMKQAGEYSVAVRYTCTKPGGELTIKVGGGKNQKVALDQTATNEWRDAVVTGTFKTSKTTFYITNTGGKDMYIDKVTMTPLFPDGIEAPETESVLSQGEPAIFDLQGRKVNSCRPSGIYIIRTADGRTYKRYMK